MIEKEVKLTFLISANGETGIKKTLNFGYVKSDVTQEEVKALGTTILNSDCYPFTEFIGAAIVDTETTDIEL